MSRSGVLEQRSAGLPVSESSVKPWFVSDGLEMEEEGLYHLPRDHAWHSGPTYFCVDFNEWHYFTFRGTELHPFL
jgi:hypothetical protein